MKRVEFLYECPICGQRQWEPAGKGIVICTQPKFPHVWCQMERVVREYSHHEEVANLMVTREVEIG